MSFLMNPASSWWIEPPTIQSTVPQKPVFTIRASEKQQVYSDEQLVNTILKMGNRSHFRMLIARYKSRVHGIALSVLGPGRYIDAQDVAQEIFVRVYAQLDSFRGQSKFSTWLFRISVNASIDYLRRSARHQGEELNEFAEPVSTRHAEHVQLDREMNEAVMAAVNTLEPRQQMIVRMFYWQGFKIREIAEILEIPEGSIKVYLLRARKHLASLLEDFTP